MRIEISGINNKKQDVITQLAECGANIYPAEMAAIAEMDANSMFIATSGDTVTLSMDDCSIKLQESDFRCIYIF